MNRPLFNTAWMRFQEVNRPAVAVGRMIGGNVGLNLASGAIENAASVRMSYVLNRSGLRIPRIVNKTISGADGSWYFTRVNALSIFMQTRFGKADIHSEPIRVTELATKHGLLVLDVPGWSENGGHATLWNGSHSADGADFSMTRDALLWILR